MKKSTVCLFLSLATGLVFFAACEKEEPGHAGATASAMVEQPGPLNNLTGWEQLNQERDPNKGINEAGCIGKGMSCCDNCAIADISITDYATGVPEDCDTYWNDPGDMWAVNFPGIDTTDPGFFSQVTSGNYWMKYRYDSISEKYVFFFGEAPFTSEELADYVICSPYVQ